jgi:hypothetical protein
MAKDPANMTHAERMSALMRELHNSACVAKADKMLELIGHEWLDVLGVRDMAARRHGDTSTAPPMPVAASHAAVENAPHARSGSVAILVDSYRSDERSPYHKLRFNTRTYYDSLIKRILEDCGDWKLADLKVPDIERLSKSWTAGGKIAMGKALITMLRSLVYFGATTLEDGDCKHLSVALHRMRFDAVKSSSEPLTADQAIAVRDEVRKMGRASIALAQAFQFDCKLRQKDVIGEWVPVAEPGKSDVQDAGKKWLRGIRWEQINDNLMLTHTTSKSQKEIVADLKLAPMVMAELKLRFGSVARNLMPAKGPIIISEASDLPWRGVEFRRIWRAAADTVGIPRTVKNMGSRIGSKSEQVEGDDEEDVDLSQELGERPSLTH